VADLRGEAKVANGNNWNGGPPPSDDDLWSRLLRDLDEATEGWTRSKDEKWHYGRKKILVRTNLDGKQVYSIVAVYRRGHAYWGQLRKHNDDGIGGSRRVMASKMVIRHYQVMPEPPLVALIKGIGRGVRGFLGSLDKGDPLQGARNLVLILLAVVVVVAVGPQLSNLFAAWAAP
jgi:hypothetical protein